MNSNPRMQIANFIDVSRLLPIKVFSFTANIADDDGNDDR